MSDKNFPSLLSLFIADCAKGHFLRWAVGLAPPLVKQCCIILHDVLIPAYAEFPGGFVDPARGPFDLRKVSNRSFIDYDFTFAVTPLGAKFLVTKGWFVTERAENRFHHLAVAHLGFKFLTAAVPTCSGSALVRYLPFSAVLSQSQQLLALAQLGSRKIVKRVHFQRAWSLLVESGSAQFAIESAQAADAEFYFHFLI